MFQISTFESDVTPRSVIRSVPAGIPLQPLSEIPFLSSGLFWCSMASRLLCCVLLIGLS